jgi:transcriptional regulator with XRE-family HTH domain
MDGDWKRLGAVARKRRESLGHSREALGEIAGVAGGSIKNFETARDGKGFTRLPDKTPQIEDALGWERGSAVTVLRGGEPTYLPGAFLPPKEKALTGDAGADAISQQERADMIRQLRELKAKAEEILARLDPDHESESA